MTLDDDPIIVQSGFKTRPLRDGGGKPSAGRRPPPLRPQSKLKHIGDSLSHLAQGCAQDVQQSINRGDRKHPFSRELLQETRRAIAQKIGLDYQIAEEMAPGQPFYLKPHLSLSGSWWRCRCSLPHKYCHGVPSTRCHHTYLDVTGYMAYQGRTQRRIPSVGGPPDTNGSGQLPLGKRFLLPGQADLRGRGGYGYG